MLFRSASSRLPEVEAGWAQLLVLDKTKVDPSNTDTAKGMVPVANPEGLTLHHVFENGDIAFTREGKWWRAMVVEEKEGDNRVRDTWATRRPALTILRSARCVLFTTDNVSMSCSPRAPVRPL